MSSMSTSVYQWVAVKYATSPLANTILLLATLYVMWKAVLFAAQEYRIRKVFNQLPGFPYLGWPSIVLGNIELYYYYLSNISKEKAVNRLIRGVYEIYSVRKEGMLAFKLGHKRLVGFFETKTVEELITSLVNIEKAEQYDFFRPWLGDGLLTSTGEQWRKHRKLLTPAFHFKILESFVPVMNENVRIMLDKIDRIISNDSGNSAKAEIDGIDIRPLVTSCTLDTICETAMGVRVGAQEGENVEYVQPINTVLGLVMNRMLQPLYQMDFMYNISPDGRYSQTNLRKIHSFIRNVISDRRTEVKRNIEQNQLDVKNLANDDLGVLSRKRYAFLDSLLLTHFKNPKEFTEVDIHDEVNTFMFEGHDTTSISLIFTTLLIASDQRVQDKIYEEMDVIFDGDMERPITVEDCRQMKYLEMCIKEGLRLYPSVPFIGRKINQEFKVLGKTIPAGCSCAIFIVLLHRDPKVFPQPERFIPERFAPDEPIHRMPYAYMPFSAGPRNCIGQKFAMLEMKILLASLLRQYRVKAVTHVDEVDVQMSVLFKADSPVKIRFERRKKNETN